MHLSSVSPREKEVLELIAHEHTAHEIASKLFISPHTVFSHRKNLLEKLGVRNTAGMIRVAFETGLISASRSSFPHLKTANHAF